jgi:ElaA protein
MIINVKPFNELSLKELYDSLQLRNEVFIVEQNCVYQDIDGFDEKAFHVLGYKDEKLIAYARLFGPGIKYSDCSIGRVVVRKSDRLNFLGKALLMQSILFLNNKYPSVSITISAQLYLKKFYEEFNFKPIGEIYSEDGIPHIKMTRPYAPLF